MFYIYWKQKSGREGFVTICSDYDSAVAFIRNLYVRDYNNAKYCTDNTYYFMKEHEGE